MRVLMGCDSLLKYTAALARAVADDGAEVKLLGRDHGLEFGGDAAAMRGHVDAVLGDRVEHLLLTGRVRQPSHWSAALAMRRRVGRFDPDVVHLQENVENDPGLSFAAVRDRSRLAVTVHDPVEHAEQGQPAWVNRGRRRLIRSASLLFVHAEALRGELIEALDVRAPVVVVPHGIEPPRSLPFPEAPRLLMFGRIHPYKGVADLLEAMAIVWRARPELELTIAGQGQLPESEVLDDPRVTVRNEHVPEDEVEALFAAARCVVLPYREASQSGVGSLAKRYGRPIVATSIGGLPELVGEGGRLVAPAAPAELAEALLAVAGERAEAERLGAIAAGSIEGGASWADVARLTLAAYREHLPQRS